MEDNRPLWQRFGTNLTIELPCGTVSAPVVNFVGSMSYLYALPAFEPVYPLGGKLPRICSLHAYDDCPQCFGPTIDDWNDNDWIEFEDTINRGEL